MTTPHRPTSWTVVAAAWVVLIVTIICSSEAFPVQRAFQQQRTRDHTSTGARTRIWSTGGKVPNSPTDDETTAAIASTSTTVRETELGRMARGIARTGMKDLESLQVGDVVVAKYEIPSLDIWVDAGYEITDLYCQGVNAESGQVEQIPLASLAENVPKSGYSRYMKVYSPKYHSAPVVVTPEEIGLVTLKSELYEAMLLAIPGFFWVFVASAFASSYNAKYGGNFFDAFFRT